MDTSKVIISVIFLITSLVFLLAGLAFGETTPTSLTDLSTVFYNIAVGTGTLILAYAAYRAGRDWLPQRAFEQKRRFIDESRVVYDDYFDLSSKYIDVHKEYSIVLKLLNEDPSGRKFSTRRHDFTCSTIFYMSIVNPADHLEALKVRVDTLEKEIRLTTTKALVHKSRLESIFTNHSFEALGIQIEKPSNSTVLRYVPNRLDKLIEKRTEVDDLFSKLYISLSSGELK